MAQRNDIVFIFARGLSNFKGSHQQPSLVNGEFSFGKTGNYGILRQRLGEIERWFNKHGILWHAQLSQLEFQRIVDEGHSFWRNITSHGSGLEKEAERGFRVLASDGRHFTFGLVIGKHPLIHLDFDRYFRVQGNFAQLNVCYVLKLENMVKPKENKLDSLRRIPWGTADRAFGYTPKNPITARSFRIIDGLRTASSVH